MSTTRPRLNVSLTPEARAVVARLAGLNRMSQSRVIAEVIEEAMPVLGRVADALENVRNLSQQKSAAIRETLEAAQADAEMSAATALALLERIADREPTSGAPRPASSDTAAERTARTRRRRRPSPQ